MLKTARPEVSALCVLGFALMMVLGTTAFAKPAPKPKPKVVAAAYTTEKAMTEVTAALDRRDCAGALPGLVYLWSDAVLIKEEPKLASQMRRQRVLCVALVDGLKPALSLSEQNLKTPGADIDAYNVHMLLELQDAQIIKAGLTLDQAVARFPEQVEDLNDEPVLGILSADREKDRNLMGERLDRLNEAGWEAKAVRNRSYQRFLGLERLRDLSKLKTAPADKVKFYRTALEDNGFFYMLMMSDQALTPASAPVKTASEIINQEIVEAKIALIKHPEDLSIVDQLTSLYAETGQEQQSISLLSRYLDLIDQNGLLIFQHPEAYQNLLVKKAGMLANQDRHDEVLEVFKTGEAMLAGQENFDLYTGYMNYLIDMGREKEALALETKLDVAKLDGDQKEELSAHKACAYAYLKDTAKYDEAMKGVPDHGLVRLKPLICNRDQAGAAKNIIAMLADPKMRDDAAILVQNTLPPKPWTPRDQAYVDLFVKIRQSPEVLAAAKAAKVTVRKWDVRY